MLKRVLIASWAALAAYLICVAALALMLGRTPDWLLSPLRLHWLAELIKWFYIFVLIVSVAYAIRVVYRAGMERTTTKS